MSENEPKYSKMPNARENMATTVYRNDQMMSEITDIKKDLMKLQVDEGVDSNTLPENLICSFEKMVQLPPSVRQSNLKVKLQLENLTEDKNLQVNKGVDSNTLPENLICSFEKMLQLPPCVRQSNLKVKLQLENFTEDKNLQVDEGVDRNTLPENLICSFEKMVQLPSSVWQSNLKVKLQLENLTEDKNLQLLATSDDDMNKKIRIETEPDSAASGKVYEEPISASDESQASLVNKTKELTATKSQEELNRDANKAYLRLGLKRKFEDLLLQAPLIPDLIYDPMKSTNFLGVLETHLDKRSTAFKQVRYWIQNLIPNEWFILDKAAQEGHIDLIAVFLKNGLPVDEDVGFGHTMLHSAAMGGQVQLVDFLLALGADIESRTMSDCWAPLHCAARYGRTNVVKLLIRKGADINARDETNSTPLHWASRYNHEYVIQALLKNNCDENIRNHHGKTPLQMTF